MIRGAFRPITTRQSFSDAIEIFSDLDDTYFDLTGSTVQVSIAAQWPAWWGDDYGFPLSGGVYPRPLLTCTTADGTITNPAIGVYVFTFTPARIATLWPGQYVVGINISRNGYTAMLALGDLSVLDGVVPQ